MSCSILCYLAGATVINTSYTKYPGYWLSQSNPDTLNYSTVERYINISTPAKMEDDVMSRQNILSTLERCNLFNSQRVRPVEAPWAENKPLTSLWNTHECKTIHKRVQDWSHCPEKIFPIWPSLNFLQNNLLLHLTLTPERLSFSLSCKGVSAGGDYRADTAPPGHPGHLTGPAFLEVLPWTEAETDHNPSALPQLFAQTNTRAQPHTKAQPQT